MTTLQLEVDNECANRTPSLKTPAGGVLLVTPELGADYWMFRVKLSAEQAIIGFPKFTTIGIGFAVEGDDWNTNLPYRCETEEIWQHISCNKGDDAISDDDCRHAIRLIQDAAAAVMESEKGAGS